MTYLPSNSKTAFLPTYQTWPEDYSQFLITWNSVYTLQANAVNLREISQYDLVELLNGQQFFNPAAGETQKKRFAYRQVFQTGAVATGATLAVNHNIPGPPGASLFFTRIYGCVVTDVIDYRPVPYASATLITDQIELQATPTQWILINGATAPPITQGIVVLEYLKN